MPDLVRKLHIYASEDGVCLQPIATKSDVNNGRRIPYGYTEVQPRSTELAISSQAVYLEASGIVGILDLASSSHLIAITSHQQVAQIREKEVYAVRDVTLIPLASQQEAEKTITAARKRLKQDENTNVGEDTDETDVEDGAETVSLEDVDHKAGTAKTSEAESKGSSDGGKEVQAKGRYKSFATRWFTKKNDTVNKLDSQAQSTTEDSGQPNDNAASDRSLNNEQDAEPIAESKVESEGAKSEVNEESEKSDETHSKEKTMIESLTPRILRSAKLLFSTSGFYYSYEHDISGTLTQRSNLVSGLPLWKRFDSMFFWNRHLIDPFINAGCDDLVLPLMQGFVGQRAFSIAKTDSSETNQVAEAVQEPEKVLAAQAEGSGELKPTDESQTHDFLLTLISRRSTKRAGLRYLRRGIDDDGNVANHIETEQVLSTTLWDPANKTFSLLQIRGSIPLHFSQSPYSFKPTPVIFGSQSTNQAAFTKHFSSLTKRYGNVQIVSLIDTNPPEVTIGEAYENYAKHLQDRGGVNGKDVNFEWFDFHTECKGMNFQNVSILMDAIRDTLGSFGWNTKQEDRNTGLQTGVVRTNCMDCLDRTNVVQQAIAEWALEKQLGELGPNIDLRNDPKTQWFNTLWADNGDNMSKQYAGTAALKGDFTRTRKRTWTGAMSDFGRSLTRYYNNIFGDYFLQTCIDYFLGIAGPNVFDDFETDMMSKDYALNMVQIRSNAIDTCMKTALDEPPENLVGGWTFSCPKEANTLRTFPFEECVILLTKAAFYFCQFDWNTEKVNGFERVELIDVTELYRGAYITSTLGAAHVDEAKNVGFSLQYKKTERGIVRTGTHSLRGENGEQKSEEDTKRENGGEDEKDGKEKRTEGGIKDESQQKDKSDKEDTRLLAFKALQPEVSAAKDGKDDIGRMSEVELVKRVCSEIQKATAAAMKQRGPDHLELDKIPEVEEKDVISVKDARKSTGYVESIGYSMKRLVWS